MRNKKDENMPALVTALVIITAVIFIVWNITAIPNAIDHELDKWEARQCPVSSAR